MPIHRIKLTPESGTFEACRECARRTSDCHAECPDYAVDVILGILGRAEHAATSQYKADIYCAERERTKRGLR